MDESKKLLSEINAVAAELGISPSTVGRMAGQGGSFTARLDAGKRVWPETANKVRGKLRSLRDERLSPAQTEGAA